MEVQFPGIAKRFETCINYMDNIYDLKPGFGLYWNFCVNAPRSFQPISYDEPRVLREGPSEVLCDPHLDGKNLALAVCLLFIYGASCDITLFKLKYSVQLERHIQIKREVLACGLGGRHHHRAAPGCLSCISIILILPFYCRPNE